MEILESRDRHWFKTRPLYALAPIKTENEIAEARTRLVGLKIKGFGKNEKAREESC